ncbi:MAG: LamB/YcsF family protein [Actinomycetota bacterium]
MQSVDLNADVGEGADDAPLYEIVTSVNIACGAHAGDEHTMRAAIRRAIDCGIAIGAHPGYADREHSGRAVMNIGPAEIHALITQQISELAEIAEAAGVRLHHVKPHGALYNQAALDIELAESIAEAVKSFDDQLRIVGLAGSKLIDAANRFGIGFLQEGFCDRAYRQDGTLVPRSEPAAIIDDHDLAARQAIDLARKGIQTLCVHADSPGAVKLARSVRTSLIAAGFELAAPLEDS